MMELRSTRPGFPLRELAVLAMARVEAGPDLIGDWRSADADALHAEAARRLAGRAHAAAILGRDAGRLVAGIALVPFLEPGGAFGPAWAGHAFASGGLGDRTRLREPDLTGELARLMGPAAGRRGAERARSFLRILTKLAGAEADAVRDALADGTRPVVTPEHAIARPRSRSPAGEDGGRAAKLRLDLLFEWPIGADGRRAVVAVEAKLGAVVGDDQLRPYREEARRRARGGPVALVLLTAVPDAAERRHRAWKPVRWFALLRRWEAALAAAGDVDPAFARLRGRLWRYLLDNPRTLR